MTENNVKMQNSTNKIDAVLAQLLKAADKFREFRGATVSDMSKAASIQAFEYTFELAWKYMREVLRSESEEYFDSPKGMIKLLGKMNILSVDEVEKWLAYAENRNLTVHMYRQEVTDNIFEAIADFNKDVDDLVVVLGKYRKAIK